MVPQDVPQLQLAAAAAEALPRTGGGAGLQQLGERTQAQEGQRHLDDVSRLTEAAHRQVPQLRYARAERRGVRKATSFVTSHFYLDDLRSPARTSTRPLQHTPCIPRTASALLQRPQTRTCGWRGGTKEPAFVVGDPEAGALASNGQGPPSIMDRLRSTADGAQAAADLIVGAGAAGLAAAQAFRGRAGRQVRQRHERRHSTSALLAAHRQQHVRQPRKQLRLAVRLPRPGAVQQHLWPCPSPRARGRAPGSHAGACLCQL